MRLQKQKQAAWFMAIAGPAQVALAMWAGSQIDHLAVHAEDLALELVVWAASFGIPCAALGVFLLKTEQHDVRRCLMGYAVLSIGLTLASFLFGALVSGPEPFFRKNTPLVFALVMCVMLALYMWATQVVFASLRNAKKPEDFKHRNI